MQTLKQWMGSVKWMAGEISFLMFAFSLAYAIMVLITVIRGDSKDVTAVDKKFQ